MAQRHSGYQDQPVGAQPARRDWGAATAGMAGTRTPPPRRSEVIKSGSPGPLGKKKEQHLKRCRTRIKSAKAFRQHEGYDDLWKRLKDLYRTKHFNTTSTEDRIAIGICFSTINVIAPSIAVNYPKVTVAARQPENEEQSRLIEALVNYWWRTFEIKPEFRRAVKDFLIFGFGWLKTGYRFVEEEEPKDPDEIADEYGQARDEVDSFALEQPDMASELPTDEDIQANLAYTKMRVVEDRPFVERVSIRDIYVDPEATHPNDMRWIAQKCVKDIEEVKSNEDYKPAARKRVKADGEVSDRYWPEDEKTRHKPEDAQRVTVWEFYDIRQGTMCVFPEDGDDFLVDPVDQPYAFGHPFIMLRNYEVPDQFYPMGELEAIEDLQQELNKTRSQQMNDRKRFRRKYLYKPEAFGNQAVGILEGGRDGAFVPVNEGVELQEAVIPLPQVPLEPSIYAASEQIEGDINTITGVSEYQRGGGDQAIRRTATEASIIQDAANARAADKLSMIEDYISQVARRLIQLAQQYTTEPQVVRLTGRNGHPMWFEMEPQWIQGEYDFEVEAGSTKPDNDLQRRDTAMQMLQALGPYADPQLGLINIQALLEHVLSKGFGIKDPGRFMGPGPMAPPDAQQAMEGAGVPPGAPPVDAGMGAPPQGAPPEVSTVPGIPQGLIDQLGGQVGLNLEG